MDDSFAFHPPGLSPSRFNLPHPGQQQQQHDPYRPGSSSGASPGTSNGVGPAASGAFTATLPPVQEQAGADAAGRPTLVGFEQLTGEDLNAPGSSHGLAGAFGAGGGGGGGGVPGSFGSGVNGEAGMGNGYGADATGGGLGGAGAGGTSFRDPFARPLSPTQTSYSGGGAIPPSSSSASSHAFFNPQPIHPSVNSRNTRPMTAPSGPFYNAYSAAPSGFYAPAPSAQHPPSTAYDGMQLAHPGSMASTSSFQYQVDSGAAAAGGGGGMDAYESYRARGFSLPDVNGALDPPSSAGGLDDSSPTGTTPFFYTPPSVQQHPQQHHQQPQTVYIRPVTAAAAYPTVLDHSAVVNGGAMGVFPPGTQVVHPLLPTPAGQIPSMLPPGATLLDPLSNTRPVSSGGPPPPPSSIANNVRRPSGSGPGGAKHLNFVPQAGQATKRPRRRYDEIERLYGCDYPGCTKAYGTLNHLNSHKTMQKHGPKSTPAQFKEMRKAWRERKKSEAAAAARARAAAGGGPSPTTELLPTPGLPSAFTIPSALERPRPSTSAGEYHLSLAAPTYPVPPAAGYAGGAQTYGAGTFIDPQGTTWTTSFSGGAAAADPYGAGAAAGGANGALRPMTAPSYYVAPAFGGLPQQQQHQPSSGALYGYAPRINGHQPGGPPPPSASSSSAFSTLGAAASADRRFSLPSTTLAPPPPLLHTASAPTVGVGVGLGGSPEMKMPQPVLGYQQAGHAALIGGGGEGEGGRRVSGSAGGGGAGDGLASLGLATGGGGAAKLVLNGGGGGGAGGEGEGTAFEA